MKIAPEVLRAAHAQLIADPLISRAVDAGLEAARLLQHPAESAAHKLAPDRCRKPLLKGATALRTALQVRCEAWAKLRRERFEHKSHVSAQTLRERAAVRVRNAAYLSWKTADYKRSGTSWAGGEHTVSVAIGTPCAIGDSTRVWSSNGKWSGSNSSHALRVPLRWLVNVERRGIAVVDGLFTLDAEPIGGSTSLLSATWVTQGRGFTLNVVQGILGYDGKTWRHKTTKKRAA